MIKLYCRETGDAVSVWKGKMTLIPVTYLAQERPSAKPMGQLVIGVKWITVKKQTLSANLLFFNKCVLSTNPGFVLWMFFRRNPLRYVD